MNIKLSWCLDNLKSFLEEFISHASLERIEEASSYNSTYYKINVDSWSDMFGLDLRNNNILHEESQDDSQTYLYTLGYFVGKRFVSVIRWQAFCEGDSGLISTEYQ